MDRSARPAGRSACLAAMAGSSVRSAIVTEILVLCTANVCRSPMAQALLGRALLSRRPVAPDGSVRVSSAGTLGSGASAPGEVVTVMAGYGLDLTGHRSHVVTAGDLARADLILAMAREHLRHAVVIVPEAWPRAFTIRELVRRGDLAGCRPAGEAFPGWLARVHAGRSRMALLGDSAEDDVADPMGGPLSGFDQTAAELQQLAAQLVALCWPGLGA